MKTKRKPGIAEILEKYMEAVAKIPNLDYYLFFRHIHSVLFDGYYRELVGVQEILSSNLAALSEISDLGDCFQV